MMSPVTIPKASGPRPFSFLIGELKIYYTSHVNKSKNQTKLKKKTKPQRQQHEKPTIAIRRGKKAKIELGLQIWVSLVV